MAMVNGPGVVRPARGTRPANRRDLIVAAASELFSRKGYANVGMGEVAEAVAIGPSALYRHFRGKHGLLAEVVAGALQTLDDALATAPPRLDQVAAALANSVLAHRGVGVLWRRESRHLVDDERAAFRAQARRINGRMAEFIGRARPELEPAQRDVLAWSALSVANSVSFHSLSLPDPEFPDLLTDLVLRTLEASLPSLGTRREPGRQVPLAALSRREAILTEATKLFAQHGFTGVSVEDIGAAVGIAGPSVYNHFDGKADILAAAILRGDEWLRMGMHQALARAADERDALDRILTSYSGFVFETPQLMQTLLSETSHLPEAGRGRARAAQRAYIAEWVHLLGRVHPEWDPVGARVRVQAVQSMINDTALTPHLRALPDIEAVSAAIGAQVLGLRAAAPMRARQHPK
ncbi:TetR/AcrR family transcriptional regulator [Nocardia sp. NPDC048505]|uniref:TetR/AcrR family transcriptional regulator n=1 Tax=unclassified Nocardia TaxID=2637762 RepID=UPI0033C3B292